MTPAVMPRRRLFFNSSPVYSRPNINRSRSTPISAPIRTKLSLRLRGARPPLPKARPAKRYKGMAEKPQRLASLAEIARPTSTRPSSIKRKEALCAVIIGLPAYYLCAWAWLRYAACCEALTSDTSSVCAECGSPGEKPGILICSAGFDGRIAFYAYSARLLLFACS
jgi:hypothetical protein